MRLASRTGRASGLTIRAPIPGRTSPGSWRRSRRTPTWVGLSEITAVARTAITCSIERDNLTGDFGALKTLVKVDWRAPRPTGSISNSEKAVYDLLPASADHQWLDHRQARGRRGDLDGRVFGGDRQRRRRGLVRRDLVLRSAASGGCSPDAAARSPHPAAFASARHPPGGAPFLGATSACLLRFRSCSLTSRVRSPPRRPRQPPTAIACRLSIRRLTFRRTVTTTKRCPLNRPRWSP